MSANMGHDRSRKIDDDDDEEEDPVENMMKKTGCLEKHYIVQVRIEQILYGMLLPQSVGVDGTSIIAHRPLVHHYDPPLKPTKKKRLTEDVNKGACVIAISGIMCFGRTKV